MANTIVVAVIARRRTRRTFFPYRSHEAGKPKFDSFLNLIVVHRTQHGEEPFLAKTVQVMLGDVVNHLSAVGEFSAVDSAVRMVFHPQGAEEVLIKVATKLSTFKRGSKFRIWLCRIAANYVLRPPMDALRKIAISLIGLTAKPPRTAMR